MDDLDDLLDQLPPALARKVAAALAPDPEPEPDEPVIRPYLEPLGPCPVTFDVDTYLRGR